MGGIRGIVCPSAGSTGRRFAKHSMTITIPDTMAHDIVAAIGQVIARSFSPEITAMHKRRAEEFIAALDPNAQEPCRWLLTETIKIWSESK